MILEEYKEIVTELFENKDFEAYDALEFIQILEFADGLYHNDEDPIIDDAQYDLIRRYAEALIPSHVYFTGVGSDIRGDKVKLPYTMGSLNQIYEGDIENWVIKNNLPDELIVKTDKLDGTSAMVVYDSNGDLQIAYSRGDGYMGGDITRHFLKIKNVPNNIGKGMVIRGEVILEKATFPFIQSNFKSKSGKKYKNARNAIAGFMNSKTINDNIYDYIKFVAYQIIQIPK